MNTHVLPRAAIFSFFFYLNFIFIYLFLFYFIFFLRDLQSFNHSIIFFKWSFEIFIAID